MKSIERFPNYSITINGKVWSHLSNRWLKSTKQLFGVGYLAINLRQGNKQSKQLIHRLVLETFVGLCPEGMECRHLNGDATNNNLSNLRWGTRAENIKDSQRQGRFIGMNKGTKNGQARLTEQDVRGIIYLWRTNLFLQREIAEIYNINRRHVSQIVNRKRWKCLWEK